MNELLFFVLGISMSGLAMTILFILVLIKKLRETENKDFVFGKKK